MEVHKNTYFFYSKLKTLEILPYKSVRRLRNAHVVDDPVVGPVVGDPKIGGLQKSNGLGDHIRPVHRRIPILAVAESPTIFLITVPNSFSYTPVKHAQRKITAQIGESVGRGPSAGRIH